MIVFEDESTAPAPYGTLLPAGPVVVLSGGPRADATPFRGGAVSPERADLLAGTLPQVLAGLEATADAALARSVAAGLFSAGLLAAGAVAGLLP